VQKALGVDAMVGHWEFTYGADHVHGNSAKGLGFPFLAGNVQDREWNEDVFPYACHVRTRRGQDCA
jgi:sulfur-oxidizing protein SoxB